MLVINNIDDAIKFAESQLDQNIDNPELTNGCGQQWAMAKLNHLKTIKGMASLNKVLLIGHLGKDPITTFLPSGKTVSTFSLATSEKYKDGNEPKEKTEWHNCEAWEKVAELADQYLKKGSKVYLEGKISTESWESNGEKKYKQKIVVSSIIFLDSQTDNG